MITQRSGSLCYFALTLGWTFAFWGIAAVAVLFSVGVPGLLLLFLGGLGPFLDLGQGFAAYRLAWATLFALALVTLSGRHLGRHGSEL